MKKIILASKSPRRKAILEQIGIPFIVDVSDFDEDNIKFKTPEGMVRKLSLEKAKIVAKRNPGAVILAADTTVVFNNEIIGKPKSKTDARRIISLLSGKEHEVITGFTIIKNKKIKTKHVVTKVIFRKLSKAEINGYIKTGEPMDKAGAYGIQDKAGALIKSVNGDYFNVVGLPIAVVCESLREFGINVTKNW